MTRLGFYFNESICVGCRTCQVACKDLFDLPVNISYRQMRSFEAGRYPSAQLYHFAGTCNHCASPKCVEGCPTGAMHKAEDGTVQHDDDICIGCHYCEWNCPYGVPQYFEDKSITGKCNACIDERKTGRNPVCVDACVMRALEFGDFDELRARHPEAVSDIAILPSSSETDPSTLITPKACALNADYEEKAV